MRGRDGWWRAVQASLRYRSAPRRATPATTCCRRRRSAARLGCSSGVLVYKPSTPDEHAAARSLPKFGSTAGPRKGVPASPLCSNPGTPFLDQHITDVYGEARCRVVNGERAGSRGVVRGVAGYRPPKRPPGGSLGRCSASLGLVENHRRSRIRAGQGAEGLRRWVFAQPRWPACEATAYRRSPALAPGASQLWPPNRSEPMARTC